MDRVRSAYTEFINRVPFYGLAVLCLDNVNVRALLPQVRKRLVTYGTTSDADYVAQDLSIVGMETTFDVVRAGETIGTLRLRLPGRHHALNALAALAVATELRVPFATVQAALDDFGGIHRRFELCGEAGGVMVISDYGHHPEEVRATLNAAREGFGRRLVVLFQPHRYTRTRDLFNEFLDAFDAADHLLLTDIYPAGEEPVDGLSGEVLYWALKRRGHLEVEYVPRREDLVEAVKPLLRVDDIVIMLGAGNIHATAEELVRSLIGSQSTWTVQ
jgi:UDP-N-acetylmuramate--alanine ligase